MNMNTCGFRSHGRCGYRVSGRNARTLASGGAVRHDDVGRIHAVAPNNLGFKWAHAWMNRASSRYGCSKNRWKSLLQTTSPQCGAKQPAVHGHAVRDFCATEMGRRRDIPRYVDRVKASERRTLGKVTAIDRESEANIIPVVDGA
jgi:hypothetical protein